MATADALIATLQGLDATSFKNDNERQRAREAVFAALQRIETPWEIVLNHGWIQPATIAALKTCIDLHLFKKWVDAGAAPKTALELAGLVDADPVLMNRLLRHVAAKHHLAYDMNTDTYALTPYANALAGPTLPNIYTVYTEVNGPGFMNLPAYLKSQDYANPTQQSASNITHLKGSGVDFFSLVGSSSTITSAFQDAMGVYAASKPAWAKLYPVSELLQGYDRESPLLVDVGGGHGHDLERGLAALAAAGAKLPAGSLMLQDLPAVVASSNLTDPIAVSQEHDFFTTPNPAPGARAYYLHCVLHDWPDSDAVKILQNIAAVMTKGYSKVLVHETVIKSRGPHPRTTTSDLTMLMCFSAAERDDQMWNRLVEQAGLRLVKEWNTDEGFETILELELA